MTTHATLPDTATVSARIAQLSLLPMDGIWALWDEHFDQRPNHHHRTWLESRLAYRLQERAFGALKTSVRRKLESIGETGVLPKNLQREADRLLPGTILTRIYDDVEHHVLVRGVRDFEYRGQRFTSLTAVAKVITGCPWSGPLFFGLKARSKQEAP
jgi:hypothetical protein